MCIYCMMKMLPEVFLSFMVLTVVPVAPYYGKFTSAPCRNNIQFWLFHFVYHRGWIPHLHPIMLPSSGPMSPFWGWVPHPNPIIDPGCDTPPPPSQDKMGYPLMRTGWGAPWPGLGGVPPRRGYALGSMPLTGGYSLFGNKNFYNGYLWQCFIIKSELLYPN